MALRENRINGACCAGTHTTKSSKKFVNALDILGTIV